MSRRPRPAVSAALCAFAVALLLAACGGSSTPSKSSAASGADNALAFSKCMREHGIKNFPNPEISGNRISLRVRSGTGGVEAGPQEMQAAQNACKRYAPSEQGSSLSPQERVEHEEAALKFAKCMRAHGIDVHASASGEGVQIQIHPGTEGAGPNPESPSFQNGQKSCQGLLPGRKGGGGPRTSSQGGEGKGSEGGSLSSGG